MCCKARKLGFDCNGHKLQCVGTGVHRISFEILTNSCKKVI